MKLSEYIADLQYELGLRGDLELVFAIDAEGNGYEPVENVTAPCMYDFEEREMVGFEGSEDWDEDEMEVNALCIN